MGTASRRSPGRRLLTVVLVIATGLLLSCGGCCAWLVQDHRAGKARVEALEQDLHQNVPVGSTRAQVKAWFAARGIADFEDHANSGGGNVTLTAVLPDPRGILGRGGEIRIMIYFDAQDRVLSIRVYRYDFEF